MFVTGGVLSGLGKGVTAASLGVLLKARGYRISMQKIDPYLNIDPGTMNPYQHGEVFVTDDGAETDLDLGHYERFTGESLTGSSSLSAGQIFWDIIKKEREGDYKGECVSIVPHVTKNIRKQIKEAAKGSDIAIVEIGGTVGDIESMPFIEAIREHALLEGPYGTVFIHLVPVPYLAAAGEYKTKPTQHSVKTLLSSGIQADILVCRLDAGSILPKTAKKKISMMCSIPKKAVITNPDANTIYEVPLILEKQGLAGAVLQKLGLKEAKPDLSLWKEHVRRMRNPGGTVKIALVGKYVELKDAYLSVAEALRHAAAKESRELDIMWVNSEDIDAENAGALLKGADGVIIPGGFGSRGIEGMIAACKYIRENNVPFFGICLGMQIACIEFARNVLGMDGAHSTEFAPDTPYPVFDILEGKDRVNIGGTLRLGAYPCALCPSSKSAGLYGRGEIEERHRHRYEFNNKYIGLFEEGGMLIAGKSPDGSIVEMVEYPEHRWYVAGQFHPEFMSRFSRPHPLFVGFIKAASGGKG